MNDDAEDALQLVGTVLEGKYEVEKWIAEGGFSLVYRARHRGWNQPVAIKVLKVLGGLAASQRDVLLEAFVREGSLLRELSSRTASILQAHDMGSWSTPDGEWYPYLVLEWLEGESLDTILQRDRASGGPAWSLDECMQLLEPAANALADVHRRGITHRDLKPANLFVLGAPRSGDAFIKVLDFGIAKVVQDVAQLTASSAKTGAGFSSFTPEYGAPEQFSRATYGATGPWTDVYAFALILVEMMTLTAPLEGEDVAQLAFASTDAVRRPTPRQRGAIVTDDVEQVFVKAFALQTTERFATLGEFWNALRAAVEQAPFARRPTDPGGPGRGPPVDTHALPPQPSSPATPLGPSYAKTELFGGRPQSQTASKGNFVRWVGAGAALCVAVATTGYAVHLARKPALAPVTPPSAPIRAPAEPSAAATWAPCPSDMVHITGGHFYMGYDGNNAFNFEKPTFPVELSPFCVDVTEVTVRDYKQCSDDGRCARARAFVSWPKITAKERNVYTALCNVEIPDHERYPINCIDWDMAAAYCAARGKRLPTSAEWEYAVRGPDGRTYPWGDEPPDARHLNGCGSECVKWGKEHGETLSAMYLENDGFPTTAPVGSFPMGRSRYGLEDVIGNVMEWVYDWDGPYTKMDRALVNPTGPSQGTQRVVRGGAWNAGSVDWVRPSFRFKFPPETRSHAVGVRCAATPTGRDH